MAQLSRSTYSLRTHHWQQSHSMLYHRATQVYLPHGVIRKQAESWQINNLFRRQALLTLAALNPINNRSRAYLHPCPLLLPWEAGPLRLRQIPFVSSAPRPVGPLSSQQLSRHRVIPCRLRLAMFRPIATGLRWARLLALQPGSPLLVGGFRASYQPCRSQVRL